MKDDRYDPTHPQHQDLMLACCANGEHEKANQRARALLAQSAPVPARPVGDLEYPRQKREPRQRVQSQREVTDPEEPHLCMACGGEAFLIGVLGKRIHLRCRHCGLDQSISNEEG